MTRRIAISLVAIALVVCGAYYAFAEPSSVLHVRWLIAHQPTEVFANARGVFESELAKKIGRPVRVELLQPSDVGYENEVPARKVTEMLGAGEVDLATIVVDSMVSDESDLKILQLPYLFKDYDSAGKVLDGEPGEALLSEVSALTGAHALAFTYSGGFRVIATREKAIRTPSDFRGMKISMWGGALVENGLASLGALPVRVPVGGGKEELESGVTDGAQLTYTRAPGSIGEGESVKYITETNHILFLSTILAGDDFLSRLSESEHDALDAAAGAAALVERGDSIAYADRVKEKLVSRGVEILPLSPDARAAFETWASQFRSRFNGSNRAEALVGEILSVQGL